MAHRRLALAFVLAVTAGVAAPAQMRHGMRAPALPVTRWVRPLANADQPAPTLFAFYGQSPDWGAGRLAADAEWFLAAREAHGDRMRTALVIVAEDLVLPAAVSTMPMAVDAGGAAAQRFLGGAPTWNLVLVDGAGVVQWLGRPEQGLPDALAAVVAGASNAREQQATWQQHARLLGSYEDAPPEEFSAAAEQLCVRAPRDPSLWALRLLAGAQLATTPGGVPAIVDRALQELRSDARSLAVFADFALRALPTDAKLAARLADALSEPAAAHPTSPTVQLALLRAQLAAGRSRDAGRQVHRVRKLVHDVPDALVDFAGLLASDRSAPAHADLAEQAIARAVTLGAAGQTVVSARYAVLLRCREDRERAAAVLDEWLESVADADPNNLTWSLLTDVALIGRTDWLALGLAERMLEHRDALDAHEMDTVALALFRAGRSHEAVQMQAKAVESGGEQNAAYAVRLQRYRAAATGAGPR